MVNRGVEKLIYIVSVCIYACKVQSLENFHVKMHNENSIDSLLILPTKFSIFTFYNFPSFSNSKCRRWRSAANNKSQSVTYGSVFMCGIKWSVSNYVIL